MNVQNINNRVLVFPSAGKLLVCADIHGNSRDYLRMMRIFNERIRQGEDLYLLFLGDLVHGPKTPSPELNFDYVDDSELVIDHLVGMQGYFPGRISSLLGNHEHGHVGGPHTFRFDNDDEVRTLGNSLGSEKTAEYQELFRTFPLIAITPAGIVFSHGAPTPSIESLDQVVNTAYEGHQVSSFEEMFRLPVLDLLWRRGASEEVVRKYLKAISPPGFNNTMAVYGHDIVQEGLSREGQNLMVLSTSFGMVDRNKTYLEVDLSRRYETTADLREGEELKKLWPDLPVEEPHYGFAERAINEGDYLMAERILKGGPDGHMRRYLLGEINRRRAEGGEVGLLEQAIAHLNHSLELENSADAHLSLAQAYEAKANLFEGDEAKAQLALALRHFHDAGTLNPLYHRPWREANERIGDRTK